MTDNAKGILLKLLALSFVGLLLLTPVTAQVPSTCSATSPSEPAQWHVPRVEHHDVTGAFYGNNYCETTILVTNLAARKALVQVNFQAPGNDKCIQDEIGPGASLAFATAPMTPIQNAFFPGLGWGLPGSVVGRATVHSDRRNVEVAVHLVCRDARISMPGNVIAMTPLSAISLR